MFAYNLLVRLYGLIIRGASLRNAKAKQWVSGRRDWRHRLSEQASKLGDTPRVWVHCASYGEFEQGRPLIEAIRANYPSHRIVLSFFSPSGFESFKDWKGADMVCYLPLDTKNNARDFLGILNPSTALFIKYEFWVNFLFELKRRGITTYLISAVFKNHHPFFKSYGSVFRRSLATFNRLFVQDENSGKLLSSIGITNYEICGDTRFDRVLKIRNNFKEVPGLAQFKGDHNLIIAGSTWPKDEEMILTAFSLLKLDKVKLLLVPHNIDDKSIAETENRLNQFSLAYSLYTEGIDYDAPVLVLNTMGMLSRAYHYGDFAYIGGGFNSGLHNSLEAAVYGIPLAFYGEEHEKFNEAIDLLKMDAARPVKNSLELKVAFENCLSDMELRKQTAEKLKAYFDQNSNVTEKILKSISL